MDLDHRSPWWSMSAPLEEDDQMWQMAERMWFNADYGGCLQFLGRWLDCVRSSLVAEDWRCYIASCREGRDLVRKIHESPLSGRTNSKPRGYAGDAETLDLIYSAGSSATHFENALLYAAEVGCSPACSVRERSMILACFIDDVCRKLPGSRILSVASGHLREAAASTAVANGSCSELIAFDQDKASLTIVESECRNLSAIKVVCGDIRRLVLGRTGLGKFEAIYCAGLFDYLNDRMALALTRTLFEMLSPGGRLLLANFAPDTQGIGFMECIQDWFLIYRTEEQMAELSVSLEPRQVASKVIFRDRVQNIVFMEIKATSEG